MRFSCCEEIFHIDMQVEGPAEVGNILDTAVEHVKLDIAARPVKQIKSHAADAAVM